MVNFGFEHLAVVDPFEAHWREAKSAVGAESLLQTARVCSTLAEAVAPCALVIGTGTLTHRKPDQPVLILPALGPQVTSAIDRGCRIALVFGPEKHGLTRDNLAHCHLMVQIPTDQRQPSMNLGQAVAVCLYELIRSEAPSAPPPTNSSPAPATSAALDHLAELIGETMTASGYSPAIMHSANRHDLAVLLRRLRWTGADARRALGLFRRILFRLRKSS